MILKVKQFVVCSDDEDSIPIDEVDIDLARLCLDACQEERPDSSWCIVAVIE